MANQEENTRAVIKIVDMEEDLKKQVIETTLEYMDQCLQD